MTEKQNYFNSKNVVGFSRISNDLAIIFALFLISILIRCPNMDRHLSGRQEWVTAQSMIALENWQSQGAIKQHFCILHSYPLKADKYISNMGRTMDKQGNWYYTSFPPFSIICPYVIFELLSISLTVLNLQIFNIITHLIATIFIYLTISLVIPCTQRINICAVLSCIFFIFMPANLWTFSNVYSWDIFCHPLWVISIYIIIALVKRIKENQVSPLLHIFLGLINFLMIYTEYLGLFSAVSVLLFAIYHRKESKQYKWIYYNIALTTLISLMLTLFQYSLIDGLGSLIRLYLHKFFEVTAITHQPYQLKGILYQYKISFLPGIIFLFLLFISTTFFLTSQKKNPCITKEEAYLIYFTLLPILLHHGVFFRWTCIHYFAVLKSSVFIVFLSSIILSKILSQVRREQIPVFLFILGLVTILLGYQSINMYQQVFASSGDDNHYNAGQYIRINSKGHETVFLNVWAHPQTVFYSKRNIQVARDVQDAKKWLKDHDRKHGIFFIGEIREENPTRPIDKIIRHEYISVTSYH